jgi:hypothetical protein
MSTDKDHAWIINETAVKQLGFGTPQKALGKKLYWHPWGASNPDSLKEGQVIGVVKDFNYKSLYDKVETTGAANFSRCCMESCGENENSKHCKHHQCSE